MEGTLDRRIKVGDVVDLLWTEGGETKNCKLVDTERHLWHLCEEDGTLWTINSGCSEIVGMMRKVTKSEPESPF